MYGSVMQSASQKKFKCSRVDWQSKTQRKSFVGEEL